MFDELVKRLRNCAYEAAPCNSCASDGDPDCVDKMMREAADAIEELEQTVEHYSGCSDDWYKEACDYKAMLPRWIPVTERLPKEMETELVTDGKNVGWSFCVNDYGTMEFYIMWTITHWMPLPEPPKEE